MNVEHLRLHGVVGENTAPVADRARQPLSDFVGEFLGAIGSRRRPFANLQWFVRRVSLRTPIPLRALCLRSMPRLRPWE